MGLLKCLLLIMVAAAMAGRIVAAAATAYLGPPHVQDLTCGRLFYRTLHLDESRDALYIGAMDILIKANIANISLTHCTRDALNMEPTNADNCISRGKSTDYDCRNHIRVIQGINGDGSRLYVCGTNAHNPKDEIIYSNLTRLGRHEFYPGIGDGIAKCPFDPEDNSTAIWVLSGNPGGHPAIYSGTNAEFTKADTVIFRGDIYDPNTNRREYTFKRTIKYDSHMLDKPDFVGSYDIGDYVYFFFRETAVEYMNCGKAVYSRIARVCKRDTGGKNILNQNWSTYLKARLNCSIPGEFPFFFNEIQSVYMHPDDNSVFYAIFTTSNNGLRGSAICSFRLNDAENVFEGKYKEQATSTSVWLPVASSAVPEPRPGSCVKDTRSLPDTVLNFIRKHPLMDSDVPHDGNGPIFYKRDTFFTRIVVDVVEAGKYGHERKYYVHYAATDDGKIYKVSRWMDHSGKYHSRLLDVLPIFDSGEPIRAMALASRKRKTLFVSSDSAVKQINLALCSVRYDNCVQCIRDPYCGWDREAGKCRPHHLGLLQDPSEAKHGLCEASTPRKKLLANFGQSIHLPCSRVSDETHSQGPFWFHYDDRYGKRYQIHQIADKYILTKDTGLVIIGVSEKDSGRYDCSFDGTETVNSYHLAVESHRCTAPNKTADYQKIYSDWCHEFQKYKTALKTWEQKQSDCESPPPPQLEASRNQISYSNPYV